MSSNPPGFAKRCLRAFCSDSLIEEIEGDLIEAYRYRLQHYSKLRADLWFILDVARFFRPDTFKRIVVEPTRLSLLLNYLRVSIQHLKGNRTLAVSNVIGLAVGVSAVVLVTLYLRFEWGFDKEFSDGQTFRLLYHKADQTWACLPFPNYSESTPSTQRALFSRLEDYPEVQQACHFVPMLSPISLTPSSRVYVRHDDKELVMDDLLYTNTGTGFSAIFQLDYFQGAAREAFAHHGTVVLAESAAMRLYGEEWATLDLVGQSLEVGEEHYEIGGVVRDISDNVHFSFDIIIHRQRIPSWAAYTYVQLDSGAQLDPFLEKLNGDLDLVFPGHQDESRDIQLTALPIADIHFTNNLAYSINVGGNAVYLRLVGLTAIVILLIVWLNFTNLSIASQARRQKQLGVRKVLGATRGSIRSQVLMDAAVFSLSALPLSLGITIICLPHFNQLLQVTIGLDGLLVWEIGTLTVALFGVSAVIGSLYPAGHFARKTSKDLLQGKIASTNRSLGLRHVLLTAQFFLLIGLMSIALVIAQQMNYLQTRPNGLDTEGVVYFRLEGWEKFEQLKQVVAQWPEVTGVGSGMLPGQNLYAQLPIKLLGNEQVFDNATHIVTSKGSMQLYGFQSRAIDSLRKGQSILVINEYAAKQLGGHIPTDLIGETIVLNPDSEGDVRTLSVAEVVPDFDYFNLRYSSQPLLIEVHDQQQVWIYNMILKVQTDDWSSSLSKIEEAFLKVEKEQPFSLEFLDRRLANLYEIERRMGSLTNALTLICLVLSIMGLSGAVSFVTLARQKEMGIRKVLGATLGVILKILGWDYGIMVLVAMLWSIPVHFLIADQWLTNFAYHVPLNGWAILASSLITLITVCLVVTLSSYRTAARNPVETLRFE